LTDDLYSHFSSPSSYELYPDALPCLEECRRAGARLGIVSNFEAWLVDCLAGLGILELLDVVVVSGIEQLEKPDPRIFELALSRTGAKPDSVLFVGDSPTEDVAPARSLGMHAVLLDRRDRFADQPGPRVTGLDHLLDHLA
jgi:HAD superfamily hydrolase (TIGR01549 family)